MKTRLDYDFVNKVYDILVSKGGAGENSRQAFIYHHCESGYGCEEWRFGGKLGQGGKYRSTTNKVDCYREDETPEITELIEKINTLLSTIE